MDNGSCCLRCVHLSRQQKVHASRAGEYTKVYLTLEPVVAVKGVGAVANISLMVCHQNSLFFFFTLERDIGYPTRMI